MNILGHFHTITAHKWRVMKYCFASGLYWQGLMHDLSKYALVEFCPGAKYYQGNRSPNEIERIERGYSAAWLHHKGRNKHHIEYWIDYTPTGDHHMGGMKIPERYVYEMICDRVAASEIYLKDAYTQEAALAYYERGKGHYMLHPETRALLEELLIMVAQRGEAATFAEIKRRYRSR
ncbi:MAG: DUF5662 family protein [Faecalibacterium sp.]